MLAYIRTDSEGLPNDVDEIGEEYAISVGEIAISVGEIALKNRLGHVDFLASYELNPTVIARLYLHARDNDSDDTLRIKSGDRVVYPAPVLDEKPKINGPQERLPLAIEDAG